VKVFLDECIDWRLARDIVGHDIKTARQMDWTTIKNGALLTLASQHFDVFDLSQLIETCLFSKTWTASRSPSLCFKRRRTGLPI
jgi:hypothetical protein